MAENRRSANTPDRNGRGRTTPSRRAAWVILSLAAMFFLTTGGTYPGIASVEGHIIGQAVAALVLGTWFLVAIVRPSWRPRTPLLLPVAIAAAVYVASALGSERSRLSLEPTIAGIGWAFAFLFLGRLFADAWYRARAIVLMTAFVTVVAVGYLGQVLLEWITWWNLIGRFAIPPLRPSFAALFLGSPNLIATALMTLAPLVVAVTWVKDRHRLALALGLASLLAIFVSGSRGAYVGLVIGVLAAIALVAIRGGTRVPLGAVATWTRERPILLVPVALFGMLIVALVPSILQRFEQGGATLRFDLWRSALTIFAEHPLLGAGPGTWVQLKVQANPDGVPNLVLPHAHDMYVQAAAEVGVVGLAALAILALAVVRRLWSAWATMATSGSSGTSGSRGGRLSLEAGAVLVSLAALAGQSIVDNLVNLPMFCLPLVALVAWIDGRLVEREGAQAINRAGRAARWLGEAERRPWVSVIGLAALALTLPTLVRVDGAASAGQAGNADALSGDWPAALNAFDSARRADPGFTLYEIQVAGALARVGRTADARDLLAHAVESDPIAVNLIGLASLEVELGDGAGALAHARRAAALAVGDPVVALNAGLLAEQLGDSAFAVDQFANSIAWNPPLARSELWDSPDRLHPKTDVIAAARARVDPLEGALILAYAGAPADARAELEAQIPSVRQAVYLAATDWLGGDAPAALARLDAILTPNPQDWFAAAWAARIAGQSGNATAYDRYSRWAIAVQGDAAPSVIMELSMVPAGPDAPTASLPGNYPWAVYLRPITPYLPMPQVVSIGNR